MENMRGERGSTDAWTCGQNGGRAGQHLCERLPTRSHIRHSLLHWRCWKSVRSGIGCMRWILAHHCNNRASSPSSPLRCRERRPGTPHHRCRFQLGNSCSWAKRCRRNDLHPKTQQTRNVSACQALRGGFTCKADCTVRRRQRAKGSAIFSLRTAQTAFRCLIGLITTLRTPERKYGVEEVNVEMNIWVRDQPQTHAVQFARPVTAAKRPASQLVQLCTQQVPKYRRGGCCGGLVG